MGLGFNPHTVEPDINPKGWCAGQIRDISEIQCKTQDGSYLKIHFQPTRGPGVFHIAGWSDTTGREGRQGWVASGHRLIASICKALGLDMLEAFEQVYDRPIEMSLGVDDGSDGYEPKNTINRARAIQSAANAPAPTFAAPPAAGGHDYSTDDKVPF